MVVAAFAVVAALWGFGSSYAGNVMGLNPLIAPLSSAFVVAAFGWFSRGQDLPAVFGRGLLVAYAAFLGLALDRASQDTIVLTWFRLSPLNTLWPVTLLSGVAFALILAVAVALPFSLIPRRSRIDAEHNDRFLAALSGLSHHEAPPVEEARVKPR